MKKLNFHFVKNYEAKRFFHVITQINQGKIKHENVIHELPFCLHDKISTKFKKIKLRAVMNKI